MPLVFGERDVLVVAIVGVQATDAEISTGNFVADEELVLCEVFVDSFQEGGESLVEDSCVEGFFVLGEMRLVGLSKDIFAGVHKLITHSCFPSIFGVVAELLAKESKAS